MVCAALRWRSDGFALVWREESMKWRLTYVSTERLSIIYVYRKKGTDWLLACSAMEMPVRYDYRLTAR